MKEINLNHICKIEGHAHLTMKIEKNKVSVCELRAAEGARFFEALVLNKKVHDVQEIVSRICGICSSAHSVCAVQALEEAMGIKPDDFQKSIRELLLIGERIRSHATHLYLMALPDYYGFSSALTMSREHKDEINDAIKLISLGNKIVTVFGGREMHPFLKIAEDNKYEHEKASEIISAIDDVKQIAIKTIRLFSILKYPKLKRKTDSLSLYQKGDYAIHSGKIKSASGIIDDEDYRKHLTENIREYATSKFVMKDNKLFVTGALARIENNFNFLDSETRKALGKTKMETFLENPFNNNIAQALEILHCLNRTKKILETLDRDYQKSLKNQENKKADRFKIKEGHAVSAVEAPRGTLFHEYKIDPEGKVTYCNIITPTAQNLNMMEQDIIMLVNSMLEKKNPGKEEIVSEVEKLIRAYDPCFSCSTHFLKVKWL